MWKPAILALCLSFVALAAGGALGAEAYRWVDEDGVIHYSDVPHPGAEEVELRAAPATTMAPVRSGVRPRQAEPAAGGEARSPGGYESLTVASPAAEETLWNIGSVLNVTLDLQPALRPGHQVRVYFDGNPRMVSGTSFQLEEVYRGSHNLQAEILDAQGNLMIRSEPTRFHVQQTSVINPRG